MTISLVWYAIPGVPREDRTSYGVVVQNISPAGVVPIHYCQGSNQATKFSNKLFANRLASARALLSHADFNAISKLSKSFNTNTTKALASRLSLVIPQQYQQAVAKIPVKLVPFALQAYVDMKQLVVQKYGYFSVLAGPVNIWRYNWPRDTAMVAVALAQAGDTELAIELLRTMAWQQRSNGSWAARYIPSSQETPDTRKDQADSAGWMLWANAQVYRIAKADVRAYMYKTLLPAWQKTSRYILTLTNSPNLLPTQASDYWEGPKPIYSLANAAMTVAGLEAIEHLPLDKKLKVAAKTRAVQAKVKIEQDFSPKYPRKYDGITMDAAPIFIIPPYQQQYFAGAKQAWQLSLQKIRQANGGYSPGEQWSVVGEAWSVQTSLYAYSAANNTHSDLAMRILHWLALHTTCNGSISEKISPLGMPHGPAPLAWSDANVVLTVLTLANA